MLDLPWYGYLLVFVIATLVGVGELVARYRDAPSDVVRRLAALLYMAINGLAGLTALLVIDAFDLTFGAPAGLPALIMQLSAAGFTGMAVLRSSLFTIRVGDTDVHAGPNALLKIILDAADRAVDRGRAQRRSQAVRDIMEKVDFEEAKQKLPSDCVALMQNVTAEEQEAVMNEVTSLESDEALGNMPRARQLGLVLMNVVGEDVLRESVKALGAEIESPPSSS